MKSEINGIHHITAIAGDPQQNHDFYTKVLGLRMVKKTVNFDDPKTYHLYYGNETGTPGTILTFFPWPRVKKGKNGTGMATEIGYAVPAGSMDFWKKRFEKFNVPHGEISKSFDEQYLSFNDPDGLQLKLIEAKSKDDRIPWLTPEIYESVGIKGFHSVVITLRDISPTASVLTDILNYSFEGKEENVSRFQSENAGTASVVDLLHIPDAPQGNVAGGTNHHVAFRVKDEEALMEMRQKVMENGLEITEKIDRQYFYSLYFREPGGVLFEIATDNPGFAIDEAASELGQHLKLPPQYESYRNSIEKSLPGIIL